LERLDRTNEKIKVLESLGLSFVQAKAYLVLTQLGRAKAGEIYKKAEIARQDIYRVLEELHKIGLVEKIVCTPINYVPIPFADGLYILLKRKRTEYEEIAKKVETIKGSVFMSNISGQKSVSESLIATVEEEVLNLKTKRLFKTANHTIEYVCKWHAFIHGSLETLEEVKKAFRKGIKGRTVVEHPKSSLMIPA
jgi:sugar-specific transcriptional regulator TrmB